VARKIIKQNSSFGVLRANPRISGNVKITVDSKSDIWLNSIDSNDEMSNSSYKAFRISPDTSYDKDLYNFFDEGKTPPQFVFGLLGEGNPIQNQIKNLSDTYNFFYSSGVSPLISDRYDEDFSYLAPIWLGEDIPDHFVIFKVNDPIDYSYEVPVTSLIIGKSYKVLESKDVDTKDPLYLPYKISSNSKTYTDGNIFTATTDNFSVLQGSGKVILLDPLYNLEKSEDTESRFYDKILPKSTIVASFDLTENSKIGKYLRKIKNTPGYTNSLIDARFEENQLTTFNGVNYSVGIFDKKGDYLLDYYKNPETQIGFEDFITNGFRNNGIISYKLLNLEFLFNDNDSENYTINRYFGLYVNAPEISTFKIDGNALYKNIGSSGNTPIPEKNNKGYYYEETSYFQYNDNGVRIYLDPEKISGIIPNSDDVNIIENTKLFWIKDKIGNFHSLKRDENYGKSSPESPYSSYGLYGYENQIVIQDKSIDLSLLSGKDKSTVKQYPGVTTGEKGRAYSVIRINNELNNINENAFIFYNPLGFYGPSGGKYDIIKASDLSSVIDEWGPGSFYSQDSAYYYHPLGTKEDIAKALTGIFNSFNYNSFESFQSGDEVIIRSNAVGSQDNSKYKLDFFENFTSLQRMPESKRGYVFINEKDVCDINRSQNFIGGSNHSNNRVKVKIDDVNKIEIGKTFIETIKNTSTDSFSNLPEYSNRSASVVVGKYRFVDQYARDERNEIVGLKDFETHATIEIETFTESIAFGTAGSISAFETYDVPVGIFSFYGLREIDMDFWYSQYGYTPTQEYYKHLDTQPKGITKIVPGKTYYVSNGCQISYPGSSNIITGPDFFQGVPGLEEYTLITSSTGAESNVYPTLSSGGRIKPAPLVTGPNFDTSFYPDLDAFPGFYGIQSLEFIDNAVGINTKFQQLNFGKLYSEYDYTKDNYNPSYSLNSRVVPYITKWVYRGGTDVRGNGYRLNNNIAFSPLNFSPSFFRRNQDPQYFTHEWYHLQRPPYSLPEENLHVDKSYLAEEISIKDLTNADPALRDYFTDYFSIEGEDLSDYYPGSETINNIDLTERYCIFDFNSTSGFSESLYRGAKIRIKRTFIDYSQGESIKYIENDTFYDDYKFSCVVVPIKNVIDKIQPPVKVKILENRTFKNITFVVEVLIEDARTLNFEDISPGGQYLDLDYFLLYSLKDKLDGKYLPATVTSSLPSGSVEVPVPGDVKLSCALNISSVATPSGLFSVVNPGTIGDSGEIYTIPNDDYETDIREEINLTYLPSVVPQAYPNEPNSTGPGSFYGIAGPAPYDGYRLPFPTGVGEGAINFTALDSNYEFNFIDIGIPGPIDIPTVADFSLISKIPIYQRDGGVGYWKNILEKISFANLSLWVNTGHKYIDYKSYVWNAETGKTDVLDDQFVLEFIKPSALEQNSVLTTSEITDKPQELRVFNVGYNVNEIEGESDLYRYSGEYVPSFREVLKFENVKYDLPYWVLPDQYKFTVKVTEKDESSSNYDIGSNFCYQIDGKNQDEINLIKGVIYYFDLSDPSNSGYKLYFSENSKGNNFSNDALLKGYRLVGIPGNPGSYVRLRVPYNFPTTVYYVSEGGKYMGGNIKVIDPIEYSYCSFGPYKDNFGTALNVNYYKYSSRWIYRIGQNSPYNPVYNLIGEIPIDRRNLGIFQSSWDAGFYREYTNPTKYEGLPGTRVMKEEKSFFGSKFMQTPDSISSQKHLVYNQSLKDVLNINYDNYQKYEILWENTPTELRGVLLIDRMLNRYFLENGGKKSFEKFIVPEFGFGTFTDVDDDFKEYMNQNIVPIFQSKNNSGFLKKVPVAQNQNLDPVVGDLADYQKLINGYFKSSDVRYTKVNELRYEFRVPKDPSFNYSLCFSIDIGKI
jgi:hypothetical protein